MEIEEEELERGKELGEWEGKREGIGDKYD